MGVSDHVIFAVPKGRLQEGSLNVLASTGVEPDPDIYNPNTRKLLFETNNPKVLVATVRSFDVANFVDSGSCDFGICGTDALREFGCRNIYKLKTLEAGQCRLSVACPEGVDSATLMSGQRLVRVATKFVNITTHYYNKERLSRNIEFTKLNGSIELAAALGRVDIVVDLVSSGDTLRANHLVELETIMHVSACIVVNKHSVHRKGEVVTRMAEAMAANN